MGERFASELDQHLHCGGNIGQGNDGQLGNNEAHQGIERFVHEAIRMKTYAQHICSEP